MLLFCLICDKNILKTSKDPKLSIMNRMLTHSNNKNNKRHTLLEEKYGTPGNTLPPHETVFPHLPTYNAVQISQHDSKEKRVWVSFKCGVYDITDFLNEHPGGDKIMMAAGASTEPFWKLYAVHNSDEVMAIMEKYRIGNLDPSDQGEAIKNVGDPYCDEPKRHPALKPSSKKPFNGEPPLSILADNFITPNDLFYVRNHLPVPNISEKEFELEIKGLGNKEISLKLDDLKKNFEKTSVIATIQCAGNRRSNMSKVKNVKGLSWGSAAIGTAKWSGVRLRDVLKTYGIDESNLGNIKHVHFEGLDTDVANVPYAASIPIYKAIDPRGDVILAYEMNDEPISPDHGYPLRVIVPGTVGARNVKWLNQIVVSDKESDGHWQQNDYKGFSPSVNWDTVDFTKSPAIQELPVQSAICEPENEATVTLTSEKTIKASGYAWSGGGRKIIRVDVSADGGATWLTANLEHADKTKDIVEVDGREWAWALWKVDIPVLEEQLKSGQKLEIVCKAWDSSYNTQPENVDHIWNLRGVLSNAWFRVNVNLPSN
ncbi:putative sulfite oxidase, mitochondrial [Nymphon striatum]|nr:putative sulfite oxidase, mitochondrial [Nymphon striatum]